MGDTDRGAKRPTDGGAEPDEDVLQLYRRAMHMPVTELSYATKALFRMADELVEVATNAALVLSRIDSEQARHVHTRYCDKLAVMAKLAIFQRSDLSEVAGDIADMLAVSQVPEAKEHSEKLRAILSRGKSAATSNQ